MLACDNFAGCGSATYQTGTCFLKVGFAGTTTSTNGALAGLVRYNPNPAYPAPIPAAGFVNASSGCGSALPAGVSQFGSSVAFYMTTPDGYNRTWLLKVPQYYSPTSASPLIFAFPGRGDYAANIEGQTRYSTPSINPYAVVAYVSGVNGGLESNPDNAPGGPYANVDDLTFMRLLMANLTSTYCIDTGRIFATGHSNGGGFCGVLACDPYFSTKIAAFAPNSGAVYSGLDANTVPTLDVNTMEPLGTPVQANCTPGRLGVPMLEFHGTADGTIRYSGALDHSNKAIPAIPHWVTDWSIRNGLGSTNATSYQTPLPGGVAGSNITVSQFGSGPTFGLVTHYRLEQWVHGYPNGQAPAPIDAAPVALAFFYRWTQYNATQSSSVSASSASATSASASSASASGVSASTTSTSISSSSSVSSSTAAPTTSSSSVTSSSSTSTSYACPATVYSTTTLQAAVVTMTASR